MKHPTHHRTANFHSRFANRVFFLKSGGSFPHFSRIFPQLDRRDQLSLPTFSFPLPLLFPIPTKDADAVPLPPRPLPPKCSFLVVAIPLTNVEAADRTPTPYSFISFSPLDHIFPPFLAISFLSPLHPLKSTHSYSSPLWLILT